MATTNYTNPISTSNNIEYNIYSAAFDSTVEIYKALQNFAASETDDGIVKLPSGQEVNLRKLSGMTAYSVHLQLLQAHKETIDNVLVFVKNLENKLDNLLSS